MPTYVYRCRACGVTFECRQSMTDEPLSECPECGGEVRRVIQPVPILFKGPGFYVTDSKGANPTARVPSNGDTPQDKGQDKSEAGGGASTERSTEKT
jgi:putative FmdB family regulatory protein